MFRVLYRSNRTSPYHPLWVRAVVWIMLACGSAAHAQAWSDAKKQIVTTYMQQYRRDWTLHDTELLSQGSVPHTETTVFIDGKPVDIKLRADDGRMIPVSVIGQSILVDGKDLSGNLGSKTTMGNNSPIIQDVAGSQITTGNSSPLDTRQSNYTVNISLSVALTISLATNFYLFRKRKEQTVPDRRRLRGA